MNQMDLYGTLQSEPTQLELRNRTLARKAAAEGFVLLKNDGALPLTSKKVALYGMGARKTVKGGLGSGSVEERCSVTIEEGLKNAGYEITTRRWLDDYDREYEQTYAAYHDLVEEKVAGLTNPMEIIPLAHRFVYRYPSGRAITPQDVSESDADTAIYVLMRQAGEGNDRKLEKGDYYITDIEKGNLLFLTENYRHVILIVNVGGLIDFAFLDEIPGIDAVVLFVQGGEEGGNALADVLSGKVNFSGRLTDTIPLHYEDIPFGDQFSYLNGDLDHEYYHEGIYVGYRYFDSFHKAVRFPFGFGLSYTNFDIKGQSAKIDGSMVTLAALVKNTGTMAGKEVVQLYVSAPQMGQAKEYQRLVTFEKTANLGPGESQLLTLSFDVKDAASYEEDKSAWVLEAGDYVLRLGRSSRDTEVTAVLRVQEGIVTEQLKPCCVPTDSLEAFIPAVTQEQVPSNVPHLVLDASAIKTRTVCYHTPEIAETDEEKEFLDKLSAEEMAWLLQGGEAQQVPKGALDIHGAAGKTATALLEQGLGNVIFSDGPAGVNIVNRVQALPDGGFAPADVPERYKWGILAKVMAQRFASIPGKIVYRYATAWPVELLLAQTWNKELLREIGEAVGDEMTAFGITVWLAPGMNIHRNPLGGRTFEYYSEDPLLSGEMAAELTKGVQSRKGCYTCIKHFCCNNTEDNRNGISSNVSERALREIYLKGFEIAIRKAKPGTLMTSYNQLNHVYTGNNRELVKDILRCEWGYQGVVMTDWNACNEKAARPELCAPAGNDLIMLGGQYDREHILTALRDGRLTADDVRRCAARVLHLILNSNIPVRKQESK